MARLTDSEAKAEMIRLRSDGAGSPPDPVLDASMDAIKSALQMKNDLARAKAASATGDSAFDEMRAKAYSKAKWMRD